MHAGGTTYASVALRAATTPDGRLLAGGWARVGAYVLDQLILGVATVLAGLPMVVRVWHVDTTYCARSTNTGSTPHALGTAWLVATSSAR